MNNWLTSKQFSAIGAASATFCFGGLFSAMGLEDSSTPS